MTGRVGLVVRLSVALALLCSALAACGRTPPPDPSPGLSSELREAVTVEGIMEHERRFAAIAAKNGGNRAAGTPGYDASARYVAGELREAGYKVSVQRFGIPASPGLRTASLEPVRPADDEYAPNTDFAPMENSTSGEVEARVRPVDWALPAGAEANLSTSGCEAQDFAGFREGNVALLRRGTCTFAEKARNAEAAGASAVLISNEGQAGRRGLLRGSLGGSETGVPVLGTSAGVGEDLAELSRSDGATVRVSVKDAPRTATTSNVVAETPGGAGGHTVMVGAHLDSVPEGPGINDNGSGSATVLEIALQMAKGDAPRNRVRFAFWGAEELGLLGSTHYVEGLSDADLEDLAVYLNFDMVGSPNFVRDVYDGPRVAEGVFTDYFAGKGIEVDVNAALDGRSDHGPFADEGVPTGGLLSGAEETKTREEAAAYGGEAGAPQDPCYHEACDDITNLNKKALAQFSDAAAHATATLSQQQY